MFKCLAASNEFTSSSSSNELVLTSSKHLLATKWNSVRSRQLSQFLSLFGSNYLGALIPIRGRAFRGFSSACSFSSPFSSSSSTLFSSSSRRCAWRRGFSEVLGKFNVRVRAASVLVEGISCARLLTAAPASARVDRPLTGEEGAVCAMHNVSRVVVIRKYSTPLLFKKFLARVRGRVWSAYMRPTPFLIARFKAVHLQCYYS